MTPSLLATLRAAGEAATPGAWSVAHWDGGWQIDTPGVDDCIVEAGHGREGSICDAAFIALARNHWDELLDAAEERDRLRAALRRYGNHDDCYRAGVDACPRYDNDNGGNPSRPCTCGFSAALGKEAP